jgi:hypothetical protein
MTSFRSTFAKQQGSGDPLDHNLACLTGTLAQLQRNGDLDRWARWAASHEIDYLEAA